MNPKNPQGIGRVAIVGTGAVGSAFAYALIHQGRVGELILVDKDARRAEGEMMDLSHCLPYGRPVRIHSGDVERAQGCDLVVITAGVAQKPGETRIDLVKRNADVFRSMLPKLLANNLDAIFVIITNPVDVMTRLARELTGLPPERVFGTGTTLDTARFRLLISESLEVDPRNVHAYVIGEHGDSEVVVWSTAAVGPYHVDDFARLRGLPISVQAREEIIHKVKTAAYEIIERKGATNFAIGIAMLRIFESISYNQSTLQTVSRSLDGAYGFGDMCLSIPCLVGRNGAARPMEMDLSEEEHGALMRSAEKLEQVFQQIR